MTLDVVYTIWLTTFIAQYFWSFDITKTILIWAIQRLSLPTLLPSNVCSYPIVSVWVSRLRIIYITWSLVEQIFYSDNLDFKIYTQSLHSTCLFLFLSHHDAAASWSPTPLQLPGISVPTHAFSLLPPSCILSDSHCKHFICMPCYLLASVLFIACNPMAYSCMFCILLSMNMYFDIYCQVSSSYYRFFLSLQLFKSNRGIGDQRICVSVQSSKQLPENPHFDRKSGLKIHWYNFSLLFPFQPWSWPWKLPVISAIFLAQELYQAVLILKVTLITPINIITLQRNQ